MSISRRQVLLIGGLGVLGAGGAMLPTGSVEAKSASRISSNDMPKPFQAAFVQAPVLQPYATGTDAVDGRPVSYYKLTQKAAMASILPRLSTPILGYNGMFPGPTISLDQGTKAVLRIRNQLPAEHALDGHALSTSTHLHGSASLPQYDGYASDVTLPGFYKDYFYPNFQPARTLWYHDHGVHFTAQNVYSGLAAMYIMHDKAERALLPQGAFDVPIVISDAMFAANGSLGYDDRNRSGLWGDVVLVNGRPWPLMKVQPRVYRFRVLNASVSRSYRPTLSTGDPVYVVATDGGLMPTTQAVKYWRHGSAERYEVLIDFSKYKPGQRIELRNLSNENNRDFDNTNKIMAFEVVAPPSEKEMKLDPKWNYIPTALVDSHVMRLTKNDAVKKRQFRVQRGDEDGPWNISSMTWEDVIASNFKLAGADPKLGAVEIWELENKSGGWFHPIHIHLIDFQILSRNGKPPAAWERGPKDVMYVGENEKIQVIMQFGPHKGRYMVHCHNLVHEDHSMMFQFRVGLKETDWDADDPMTAAKPAWDDDPA